MFYPTASTVAVFINGFHVDQAYQIQYKESANKIPIYGYNDHKFTKVVKGRQSVSGALVLNFVYPGYLNTVLDSLRQPDEDTPAKLWNAGVADSVLSPELVARKNEAILLNELPPNDNEESRKARAEFIAGMLFNGGAKGFVESDKRSYGIQGANVKQMKDNLLRIFNFQDETASKQSYGEPSPIELNNNGINLDIYYHDPDLSAWYLSFKNVHFYDVSQAISQAGAEGSSEPLYEVYSFMAREKLIISSTAIAS